MCFSDIQMTLKMTAVNTSSGTWYQGETSCSIANGAIVQMQTSAALRVVVELEGSLKAL